MLAAVILLLAVSIPIGRLLAPRPVSAPGPSRAVERVLGTLMVRQLRLQEREVGAPAVHDAFRVLLERLRGSGAAIPRGVRVIVVASPTVNSLTLPGDVLVVDSGLLARMATPEEMAAVLAHELGHVVNRDPFNLLVQRIGIGALLTIATGGRAEPVVTNALQYLMTFRYSQEAEDRADRFAIALLSRAGIDPNAFADALEHIRSAEPVESGPLVRYLDPHSDTEARIDAARAASRELHVEARPIALDWSKVIDAVK